VLAVGTTLASLGWVSPTHAAAGQWQAGGRLGAAWLSGGGLGPALDGYLRRGLTDSLELDLQVLSSIHPFQADSKSDAAASNATPRAGVPWALGIVPGLLYRWDVFRIVPYAGFGLGFYSWNRAVSNSAGGQFGASGRVGLDYLFNRSVVLSVQASVHVVNTDSSLRVPWVQIGLGAAHAWGW
jgi:hypothetical protein